MLICTRDNPIISYLNPFDNYRHQHCYLRGTIKKPQKYLTIYNL
jgi:hypothetical protein